MDTAGGCGEGIWLVSSGSIFKDNNSLPSPIAHATIGYLVYRLARRSLPAPGSRLVGPLPLLLIWTLSFALLPDVDTFLGLLNRDFGRYHNNGTHSFILGLGVAFLGASLIWMKRRQDFLLGFLVLWLSYASHVILDFFTIGGRGVMMLWPLSSQRFDSPIKFFYGVRWSEGIFSLEHLRTLASELVLVLLVGLALVIIGGGIRSKSERIEG